MLRLAPTNERASKADYQPSSAAPLLPLHTSSCSSCSSSSSSSLCFATDRPAHQAGHLHPVGDNDDDDAWCVELGLPPSVPAVCCQYPRRRRASPRAPCDSLSSLGRHETRDARCKQTDTAAAAGKHLRMFLFLILVPRWPPTPPKPRSTHSDSRKAKQPCHRCCRTCTCCPLHIHLAQRPSYTHNH
jgi:hypothetical protein